MKVSVSILSEKNNYKEALYKINKTNADYLHLDVMDGSFTSSKSFTMDEIIDISNTSNKKLDIHVMSKNLDILIDNLIKLNPEFITIHSEIENKKIYIKKIKENNIKVGLALNPQTNIDILYNYIDKIDLILVMSVNPGAGGQSFTKEVIPKLKKLKELNNNCLIEVDGGINKESINYVKNYVNIVVSGSYITNSNNYQKSIDDLR